MKDRTMLILLIVFGILCIGVKVSEDGMQFLLLWQSVSTEEQEETVAVAEKTAENIADGDLLSGENDQPGPKSDMDGSVSESEASSTETDSEQPVTYSITKTDINQTIRVLLSPQNNGTYLQPSICVKSAGDEHTYTAKELQKNGVKLHPESPFHLAFGDTEDPREFSGILYLYPEGDSVYAVNAVDLEEYTANVVPGEMPAYYPSEALRAQAVCARTYALRHMDKKAGYHADVDDTVSSQVYKNTGRKDSTDQAVSDTRGLILADQNGRAAQIYFYSTSYGFCSRDDVWQEKPAAAILKRNYLGDVGFCADADDLRDEKAFTAYIRSADAHAYESDEPWFRWHVTIPVEKLTEFCRKKDAAVLDPVTSVQITKRASGYAAKELTLYCGRQKLVIEGEYAIREFLSPEDLQLINQKETVTDRNVLPGSYIVIDPVEENGVLTAVTVYGGGYGHGVGLSQNGAKCMAKAGMDYRQILSEFFDIS